MSFYPCNDDGGLFYAANGRSDMWYRWPAYGHSWRVVFSGCGVQFGFRAVMDDFGSLVRVPE